MNVKYLWFRNIQPIKCILLGNFCFYPIVLVSLANNHVMRVTQPEFSPVHSSTVELGRQLNQFVCDNATFRVELKQHAVLGFTLVV